LDHRFGPGEAYAVAVGDSGNVFVTGFDYATTAYSGSGTALWTNRYDGPLNTDDKATAVAVDQSTGNVLVTGSSLSGSHPDYATIAYSEAGVALWTNRYNGPANTGDVATGVVVTEAVMSSLPVVRAVQRLPTTQRSPIRDLESRSGPTATMERATPLTTQVLLPSIAGAMFSSRDLRLVRQTSVR
jgi:hypothetical protein